MQERSHIRTQGRIRPIVRKRPVKHTSGISNTADGLPSVLSLGASGDSVDTAYAANDTTSSITLSNGSTLQEFAYSDAPSGAVISEPDTPSSSLSPADYTYDAQSRVTTMTPGSGGANTYGEDASSNLTTLPTGASDAYDHAAELTSSVHSGTTTSYTYDASGNRTQSAIGGSATVTAAYNGAEQLTSYDNAAADMTAATYDGEGLRTSAASTPSGGGSITAQFVWDTTAAVPALLMDFGNAYLYGPSGTPFEEVNLSTGTITNLVADALGSVRGVVSSTGTLTASTSYDAWGSPETSGGVSANTPFGFAGGYTDPSGLVYLIGRYYDPATGQFLTVDPMVDLTRQPYAYTGDDPVNGVDPNGLDCGLFSFACSAYDSAAGGVKTAAKDTGHAINAALPAIHTIANSVAIAASLCAVITSETVVGGVTCGAIASVAGGVTAVTGGVLYLEGRESGVNAAFDLAGGALGGTSSLYEAVADSARALQESAELGSASRLAALRASMWGAFATGLSGISRGLSAAAFGLGLGAEFGVNC
jgi:RHS repeat-associated protein